MYKKTHTRKTIEHVHVYGMPKLDNITENCQDCFDTMQSSQQTLFAILYLKLW